MQMCQRQKGDHIKWKKMEKFFEKITFQKNAGLLCIEASKNGGINDSAIFSISR